MNNSHHTEKNIFFLLIIAIAFVIFVVFNSNADVIAQNGQTGIYIFFAALGLGLLSTFVYLISNRNVPRKSSKKSVKKRRR